ncbi:HAMP domain-containing sensor histidine kinase, partial [Pseudonocardia zijingensis]
AELTAGAAALGHEDPRPGRPMHVPETAALAAALAEAGTAVAEMRRRDRELAADLSHRLRTPLTALSINAGALDTDPTAADRVRETVAALEKDVNALIHPAPAADAPGRCDLADVVRQRMAFWTTSAHKTGRECRFTVQAPAVVALPEEDVAPAVDDLLTNIFRHTPDGTAFAVTVVRYAGWVTLVVDDAGPGVVDPATALQRGVSELADGTGLGLAIARRTVEAAGGTIHLERAELGGSRIRLRFPEAA